MHAIDTIRIREEKKKRKLIAETEFHSLAKVLLQKEDAGDEEEDVNTEDFPEEVNPAEKFETTEGKQEFIKRSPIEEKNPKSNDEVVNRLEKKKSDGLIKEAAMAGKLGVCYLSRIPPHMDHVKLQYGEIQRINLSSEDPTTIVNRK
ncbi:pre-rRNA-processing protein ESF2-like [Hevea brasiliensis]|uniref:pre-rRNA-processing protein ESF2-like n=1 Tax=Hevea brasiliensis TaxID=3981 RepID=UPI0025DEF9FB|nr:pre-rRNA-processing protein ESF2-like [Hevea brasiliensis]